jgi:tRNA(Ile)-lysidine synthase
VRALLQRVERSILDHQLSSPGQRLLVAVSGGVDSMVLLHLLVRLSRRHGWRLAVAHFNHQLRGRSSAADERFVAKTAAALGLECHVGRGDVRALARRKRLSLEQAARSLRHRFLARTAQRFAFPTIALAHHADDQVELFFLRLFRGAGGEGLAGMKWQNPSPEDATVELVRPLLALSKAELERCARRAKIAFREDASNRSTDILRNRIRHRLLPQLRREYQPAIAAVVARVMDLAGAEAELTAATAQRWLRRNAPTGFDRQPVAVQRGCLKEQLMRAKLPPAFATIEALRREEGVAVPISPKLAVARDAGGRLRRMRRTAAMREIETSPAELPLDLAGQAGRGHFGGLEFAWTRRSGHRRPAPPPGEEHFDAAKLGGQILLRHWRAGDRFQPIGMARSVKLQDLLTNAKIPLAKRRRLVVAVAYSGEIFWVEGLRIGESCKVTSATQKRWRWRWDRTNTSS